VEAQRAEYAKQKTPRNRGALFVVIVDLADGLKPARSNSVD